MRPVRVGRRRLVALGAVVLLTVLGIASYQRRGEPPRPSLSYPAGQSLAAVRGNCESGSERRGCDSGAGPRSFLTVRTTGDPRGAVDVLFASLVKASWKQDDRGRTAVDYADAGAPEDIQPIYCTAVDGCVGLFRFTPDGYVLAWWAPD